MPERDLKLLEMTSKIAVAYLGSTAIQPQQLASVIDAIYTSLSTLGTPDVLLPPSREPAIEVRKALRRNAIICLECGYVGKLLRRHLTTQHGLTAAAYRERWNLPEDYPLVAPAYAAKRSQLAKEFKLGHRE